MNDKIINAIRFKLDKNYKRVSLNLSTEDARWLMNELATIDYNKDGLSKYKNFLRDLYKDAKGCTDIQEQIVDMLGEDLSLNLTEEKEETAFKDMGYGICQEHNCEAYATKDYNGHQYYVCDYHYNRLNNEFDEEYR